MNNFDLNKDEILTKVTKYELSREEGRIFIDVCQVLAGDTNTPFFAVPHQLVNEGKSEYIGRGNSEQEALNDCLAKIKKIPLDDIMDFSSSESDDND